MTNFIKRCHTPTQHQNTRTSLVFRSMVNDLVWPWKSIHARILKSPRKIGQLILNVIISCTFSPKRNIQNQNNNIFISKLPASNTAKILLRNELNSLVYKCKDHLSSKEFRTMLCGCIRQILVPKCFKSCSSSLLYRSYVPLCKRGLTPSYYLVIV